jgi:ribulose-phosphate 3-epimerase
MKNLIVPAIIAKNQKQLNDLFKKIPKSTIRVMLDVMDGRFVPNNSLDFDFKLPPKWIYEAHLMVSDPIEFVMKIAHKVDIIIVHYESIQKPSLIIREIKKMRLKAYIALNPETTVEAIKPYINELDGILVMTVNPGKYGSQFIKETLEKVKKIREIAPEISIEVDGGMNLENAQKAALAGANIIASGSYIMKSDDPENAFITLQSVFL